MNRSLTAVLLFLGLVLFIISPFAALAGVMFILLIAGFIWTISTIVQAIAVGNTDKGSLSKPQR